MLNWWLHLKWPNLNQETLKNITALTWRVFSYTCWHTEMVSCRCVLVIFYAKVQGDLAATATFCSSKKTSPPAPRFSIFHIPLPAVALSKCQTPDKHVMEVNLRGGEVLVGSNTMADVVSFNFWLSDHVIYAHALIEGSANLEMSGKHSQHTWEEMIRNIVAE